MGGNASFLYGAKGLKEAVAEQKEEVTASLKTTVTWWSRLQEKVEEFPSLSVKQEMWYMFHQQNRQRSVQIKERNSSEVGKNTSFPKTGKIRQP